MEFITGNTVQTQSPATSTPIRRLALSLRRDPHPDVPEDVAMLHFNDPNWSPPSSPAYSTESFDLSEKRPGARTYSSGFSTRSSYIETESQDGSQYKSTAHFKEAEEEFNE